MPAATIGSKAFMSFSASLDTAAKTISAVVFVIVAVVAALTQNLLAVGAGILILVLSYAWAPRGYTLEGGTLFIHRLVGTVRIPLERAQVRLASTEDLSATIRLFGNGGLFGYYGLFTTAKLGKCTWYVTDRSKAVVIVTTARTVLVSPSDPTAFLSATGAHGGQPSVSAAIRAQGPRYRVVAPLLAVAFGMIALGVVAMALLYSPGPPSYTLSAQSLVIHDRFYPLTVAAASVDVAGIRVIDLDREPSWEPSTRTNGFANSHYRAGHFRTAGGAAVRLYWSTGSRLVLFPRKDGGDAVLLQTADPDLFVSEVKRTWGQASP